MSRRRIVTLLLAAVFAVAGAGMPTPAQAAVYVFKGYIAPPSDSWAEIYPPYISPSSHVCLDVPRGSRTEALTLQLYHCHGYAGNGAPQRWFFYYLPTLGQYWVANAASGKCLASNPDWRDVRHTIVQVSCSTDWWSTWKFAQSPVDPEGFLITHGGAESYLSSYCITADNNSGNNGTRLNNYQKCDLSDLLNNTNLLQTFRFG